MSCRENLTLSRREVLRGGAASLALWGLLPRSAGAGNADPRLLTVILRGGLDGLALAAPTSDPHLTSLRGPLALAATGEGAGLALDGFFVLNPAMPYLHGLYQRREALIVHAVATPYRERSHFDGQDVLESGLAGVGNAGTGWLNRAVAGMSTGGNANRKGLAMGAVVPLVMRGAAPVLSWIPQLNDLQLPQSTIDRLMDLYAQTDPGLARAFLQGIEIERVAAASGAPAPQASGSRPFREFVETAQAAARFLSAADGPRIGVLSYNGWDTHANEGAVDGQLAERLRGLDAAIRALAEGMAGAWRQTIVVVVTEFGRTARINGTAGTDHGTATVALLVGGAVNGGRVIADWPGLAEKALYEGRDLFPTCDLRTVLKGVLRDHLGIPQGALAQTVFPDSAGVIAADGLVG
jgi:uncharacterized protein (DUF1501 family)